MKIAMIKPTVTISASGGVRVQALSWKEGLEKLGHEVELIDFWKNNDWKSFDIILLFEYGGLLYEFVKFMSLINPNIVVAPIIDTNYTPKQFFWACKYLKCDKLRLHSRYNDLYKVRNEIKLFLVRSEFEKRYITTGLNLPESKVRIIPLSYRFEEDVDNLSTKKENFCLHVSLLHDKRKNVERLIQAAIKYKFQLKLGGKLRNDEERRWLSDWITNVDNIEYFGVLSDEDLVSYYKRAKVFALPSTYEGVGMVALEAALFGCDIVLTSWGGPKEYYNDLAYLVNPLDVDDIGRGVMKAFEESHQPELHQHLVRNYSLEHCMKMLVSAFNETVLGK